MSSSSELSQLLKEWFDALNKYNFYRFTADQLLENDTQYDIDSLIEEFNNKYKSWTGKEAPKGLFEYELRKRCKKETIRYDYDSE